jgi:hypothetical protein
MYITAPFLLQPFHVIIQGVLLVPEIEEMQDVETSAGKVIIIAIMKGNLVEMPMICLKMVRIIPL